MSTPTSEEQIDQPPRRTRDAAASTRAIFLAAQELFGQRGFERTTTREIAALAGVDAALIARYFGSKADLYVAVMAAESLDGGETKPSTTVEEPIESLDEVIELVLRRDRGDGPGPIMQAMVRQDTSDEILDAARARLARRIVEPIEAAMEEQPDSDGRLRAELLAAALLGVSLGRTLGWFDHLEAASRDEVASLCGEILDRALEPGEGRAGQ